MADQQAQNLDQKLAGLDDNLQPIKQDDKQDEKPAVDDKKEAETKEADEKTTGKDESEAGVSEEESTKDGDKSDSDDDKSKDEGYTIDDGDEEEEAPETPADNKPDTSQLSPEQQYILDHVQAIKVRGTVGGSDKIQEFDVLAPEQLPSGFKFADDVEMAKATKGFNMLEQRASQLQNDYRTQETTKAAKEFKDREDTADRQDIAKLQKDGTLPKFKVQPNSPDFDKDTGVQLVQEVLDFKEKQNQRYMDEYNAGRPYKHIGFEEAWAMFKRDNPSKADVKQQKEDKEREDVAKRTSRSTGNNAEEGTQKARVHSGMTSRDLDHLIENLDW